MLQGKQRWVRGWKVFKRLAGLLCLMEVQGRTLGLGNIVWKHWMKWESWTMRFLMEVLQTEAASFAKALGDLAWLRSPQGGKVDWRRVRSRLIRDIDRKTGKDHFIDDISCHGKYLSFHSEWNCKSLLGRGKAWSQSKRGSCETTH